MRNKLDGFGKYIVAEEEAPEQAALRSVGCMGSVVVARLAQCEIEKSEEQDVEQESPLGDSRLEDCVQRPWVITIERGGLAWPWSHSMGGQALARNDMEKNNGDKGAPLTATYAARSGWSDCSSNCCVPSAGIDANTWSPFLVSSRLRTRGGSGSVSSSCA
jgi:hypothetical protein